MGNRKYFCSSFMVGGKVEASYKHLVQLDEKEMSVIFINF